MLKLITQLKSFRTTVLIFFLCLLHCSMAMAQSKIVTGTVKDTQGQPLVGVTVKIKGTNRGTNTNKNGKFSLQVNTGNETLVFSFVGHDERQMEIKGRNEINLSLSESASRLNEVVVVGYGQLRRSDLTGSVSSVNIKDFQKAPVKSFDEALGGRIPGVQVTSSEGQPGAAIDIVIRGNNSVNGVNYPLVVIDGFIMENALNSSIAVNPLNTIDPNDIESIDVLKDASATAIYGARGANGVIMVTTKRGKTGAAVINYNGYLGFQENKKRMEVLSPYEFVKLQNEIDPITTLTLYGIKDAATGKNVLDLDIYKNIPGINWEDQVTKTAPMQNHYLSMSGGSELTKYNASVSYTNQDGIITNTGFKRMIGKFSLDQEISKRAKAGFNANYTYVKNFGTSSSSSAYNNEINLLFSVWAYRPVTGSDNSDLLNSLYDPVTQGSTDFRINPVLTTANELRENYGTSLNANGYVEYAITGELKFKSVIGINKGSRDYDVFNGALSRSGSTGNYLVNGSKTIYSSNSWLNNNLLTFTKRFNKNHYLDALGGITFESAQNSVFGASSVLIPYESLGLSGLGNGNPLSINSGAGESSMVSFLSRVNYKLTDRYLFTASFRADGTSRFRSEKRWGYFPSAAFAWQLNKESFMQQFTFLSNAKIRTSWGISGNNQVGNYATYSGIGISDVSGYMFNNADNKGIYYSSLGNENLKWESTEQIDLGLDLGFFKERLSMGIDLYRKNTRDLLLNAQLAPSTGYDKSYKNIGGVRNQGLELSLNAVPVDGAVKWTTSLNIAFNRNKLIALTENQTYLTSTQYWGDDWVTIPAYIALLNQPIAQFYGLISDGVYNYGDFTKVGNNYVLKDNITANGESRANVKPGDVKYKDLNGDLLIDDKDRTVIGHPYPKHTGGFMNNVSYKGFDLSVFLQWSYGNDVLNANRIMLESGYKYNTNQFASYAGRWSPENQDSDIPAALGSTLKTYSTRVIEDGSYLRLKTVSVGYSFSPNLLKSIRVKSARVYVAAQNLYTWTHYSGYDPEVSVRNSALTPGFDYSAYPRARTITMGINTTF